jgi:hypothetical protein
MANHIGDEVQLLEWIGHSGRHKVKRGDPRTGPQERIPVIALYAVSTGHRLSCRSNVPSRVSAKAAAASCAYCGKGAWVKSNRPAMTRAVVINLSSASIQEFVHGVGLSDSKNPCVGS